MVTTQSGHRASNQQELSFLFLNLSDLTSSQGQPQEIMEVPVDGIQYPYLYTLDISTSEHLKLHNKSIVGMPESDGYDLTKSKWTDFYQELEDAVSTFGFKSSVLIVASRYAGHAPTEVKNIILF